MKIFLSILINKLATFICHLLGKNGSQLPGRIVLDFICPDILDRLKYPKYTIAVTGSNGKGSACNLIKHILEDSGYSVALNESGSNGIIGSTTMILNNCSLRGKFKKDCLLLECDERHLKLVFKKKKPDYLIITNITRDQPTRNGTPEIVFNDIMKIVDKNVHLVINADDPLVSRVKLIHKGPITTFGIAKTKADLTKPLLNNVDFAYCPKCHKKLNYAYYHYGHIGNYNCPNCDFSRGQVDYEVTDVNLNNQSIKINNEITYINKNVLYAAYATVAAYALTNTIGISKDKILYALNQDKIPHRLGKTLEYNNRQIIMLETKNENNISFYQGLRYIVDAEGTKSVIIGFEKVSKRYKESDLSWLYDINFELLDNPNIDKIFVFGKFKYDLATRLMYANIPAKKIIIVDDINELMPMAMQKSKGNIYTMIWYDMIEVIKKTMGSDKNA